MQHVATRRLVDAAAELGPADRALVALWVHHGFEDDVLSRITGITPRSLAERRLRVLDRLSEILGMPTEDISDAFSKLDAGDPAEPLLPSDADPAPELVPGSQPGPDPQPAPGSQRGPDPQPEPDPQAEPAAPLRLQRRAGRAAWILVPVVIAAAVLAIVVATSVGSNHPSHRSAVRPAGTTATPKKHGGAPAPTPALGNPRALSPLPGGPKQAHGEVGVVSLGGVRELHLIVVGLRHLVRGRYEVWLFNSIIDSRPLGFLSDTPETLAVRVPSGAARYRFIDVEREPPGDTNPSGESVLRAANPV